MLIHVSHAWMRPFCSLLRNRLHVITPTVHGLQNDLSYSSGRKLTDAWARERDKERKGGRTRSRVREKAEARYYFRMILCSESEKKKLFFELTAKNIRHNGCTCSQLLRLLEFLSICWSFIFLQQIYYNRTKWRNFGLGPSVKYVLPWGLRPYL